MGCWGITAFESDAGLDAVGFIRRNLSSDGRLELSKIIEALQKDEWNAPPAAVNAESHTSLMALGEIVVKFLDGDPSGLDYEEEWAAQDNKFSSVTSFTADKDSLCWLRDYLFETLVCARKNAEFRTQNGEKWNGWFKEEMWQGWQSHMLDLAVRLDEIIALPESTVELMRPPQQESGPVMGLNQ